MLVVWGRAVEAVTSWELESRSFPMYKVVLWRRDWNLMMVWQMVGIE